MDTKGLFIVLLLLNSMTPPIQILIKGYEKQYATVYYFAVFAVLFVVLSDKE